MISIENTLSQKLSSLKSPTTIIQTTTSYNKGSFISHGGQSYEAVESIKKGVQVLLIDGFAIPEKIELDDILSTRTVLDRKTRRKTKVKSRVSGMTVLYRVDKPTVSEIWIYEQGAKKLIGTYPLVNHSFNSNTLRKSISGITDTSSGNYDFIRSGFFPTLGTPQSGQILAYRASTAAFLNATGTNSTESWGNLPPVNSFSDITNPFGDRSESNSSLTAIYQGSVQNEISSGNGRATGTTNTTFSIPAGEYEINVNFNLNHITTNTNPLTGQDEITATAGVLFSPSTSRDRVLSNDSRYFSGVLTYPPRHGSFTYSDNVFSGSNPLVSVSMSPADFDEIQLFASSFAGGIGWPFGSTFTSNLTSTVTITASNFRPVAYLSKNKNNRFVGLKYLDSNGEIKVDHYVITSNLTYSKQTWGLDEIPNLPTEDTLRSLITHSYEDFLFDSLNPFWARQHHTSEYQQSLPNTYNILSSGEVTSFTSLTDTGTNPGLIGLLNSKIPEASRVLWVSALPKEAKKVESDSSGYSIIQYTPK